MTERTFTVAEIENILVDSGELVPADYQSPECDELWKVVEDVITRLRAVASGLDDSSLREENRVTPLEKVLVEHKIRLSPDLTRNRWYAGFVRLDGAKNTNIVLKDHQAYGDTPMEAVKNLIEKDVFNGPDAPPPGDPRP